MSTVQAVRGVGSQTVYEEGLHVFSIEGITRHLPNSSDSEVLDGVVGRIEVDGYGFLVLKADIRQVFLAPCVHSAPGFPNVDHRTRSAADGINDVVALTGEGPCDSVCGAGG